MPSINLTGGGAQPPGGGSGKMTPEQRAAERAGRMSEREQRMQERTEKTKGQIDLIREKAVMNARVFTERTVGKINYENARRKSQLDIIAERTLASLKIIDVKKLVAIDVAGIKSAGAANLANINSAARAQMAATRANAQVQTATIRATASTQNTAARIAAAAPIQQNQQTLGNLRIQQAQLRLQQMQTRGAGGASGGGRGGITGPIVGAIAGGAGGGFLGGAFGAAAGGALQALPPQARLIIEGAIATALAGIELQFLPGQLMHKVLGAAGPAIDLTKSTYAAGRTGGFSGAGLYRSLFNGKGTTEGSEWMGDLMLTPEKIMASLGAYGIAQRSPGSALSMARAFGRANLSGGLTGLGDHVSEDLMRQGTGYGLASNTAQGATSYLLPFAGIMEQAVAAGMDRAKVLGNIQDAIDVVAKSGAVGVSTGGILDMFQRFAAAGTPGGRTGQSAFEALAGQAGVLANPSGNPATTFMLMSQMKNFGGLKTEEGIDAFLGGKNVEALNQSPALKQRIYSDAMARAKNGSTYGALSLLMQMGMTGNPDRLQELLTPAVKGTGIPSEYAIQALGNVSGMGVAGAYQSVIGRQNQGMMGLGDNRFSPNAFGAAGGAGYLQTDDYYRDALKANGVPSKYIESFITAGKAKGVSPLMLAAIAAKESGGGKPSNITQGAESPGHDRGIMQINPANQRTYFGAEGFGLGPGQNINAGADIFANDLMTSRGNLHEALGRYNAGGNYAGAAGSQYASSVEGIYSRMASRANVPTNIGQAENLASQATLAGADTALNRFVPVVSAATESLEKFINALADAAKALTNPPSESNFFNPRGIHTAPAPSPLLHMQ